MQEKLNEVLDTMCGIIFHVGLFKQCQAPSNLQQALLWNIIPYILICGAIFIKFCSFSNSYDRRHMVSTYNSHPEKNGLRKDITGLHSSHKSL
jgi:hypothetical protein